MNMKTHPKI